MLEFLEQAFGQDVLFQIECFLRIICSGICGLAIGYERKKRGKGAGIRTHLVVALAAALMMVVSKYGFSDVDKIAKDIADCRIDPSRLASQIVTGVGFLGAGMIYFHHGNVTGLTTAAGIWATSGVGMAIGSGMYFMGIATTIVIILAQMILHAKLNSSGALNEEHITFIIENTNEAVTSITTLIRNNLVKVDNMVYVPIDNNMIEISISVSGENTIYADELIKAVNQNLHIKSVKLNSEMKV